MSKRYIRVYCNGKHIRSTGTETWYRNSILKTLGIGETECPGKDSLIKYGKELLSQIPAEQRYSPGDKTFEFVVEFIRVTKKNGKTVDKTVTSPYFILIHHTEKVGILCRKGIGMCYYSFADRSTNEGEDSSSKKNELTSYVKYNELDKRLIMTTEPFFMELNDK